MPPSISSPVAVLAPEVVAPKLVLTSRQSPQAEPVETIDHRYEARWVSRQELGTMIPQWNQLAKSATWRNLAMESNYLLPALNHLADKSVRVLVVEAFSESSVETKRLIGLLPVCPTSVYGMPVSAVEIWNHDQCLDCTPLIEKGKATEAWNSIFTFLGSQGFGMLNLENVLATGEISDSLHQVANQRNAATFNRDRFERASFQPDDSTADSDSYKAKFTSKSLRKNMQRLGRRLAQAGDLTVQLEDANSDFDALAEEFLALEASGWKGRDQTALKSRKSTREFYKALISMSAEAGKARFTTIRLDGNPIAMLSDLQSGSIVCSYKTAFDETFSSYSPGVQAELHNLDFLIRDSITLADSCTSPDNAMLNRAWGQRIQFQNAVFSLKPGISKAAVRMMPWLQKWANRLKGVGNKEK